MLAAGEALLLGEGDHLPVDDQAGGGVEAKGEEGAVRADSAGARRPRSATGVSPPRSLPQQPPQGLGSPLQKRRPAMHEGAHAPVRLYACTPVRLLHTTQQLGRSSAFERAALCCPQAGQTGVPRASKWQFVFGGRERDGHGPHTAGLGGDAERDHDLGESHAVAGTGSPATVSTSVQPASFPATKARIWASVAVPRSGNRGANSALTALPSSACPETPAPTSLPRRRTVPTFLPMDVGR